MRKEKIIWTIKELYEWALDNDVENYTVFSSDEGMSCNIYISEIIINKEKEQIFLQKKGGGKYAAFLIYKNIHILPNTASKNFLFFLNQP